MMDEELAEEFELRSTEVQPESHRVAFLSRNAGAPARFLDVKRTKGAMGPVTVKLEAVEVTGDKYLDLVIVENMKRPNSFVNYQGLKIINGDPELTSEILEVALVQKAPKGTEIVFEWIVDSAGATPKLILRGGNRSITYTYSKQTRRLMSNQLDQSKSVQPANKTQKGGKATTKGEGTPPIKSKPSVQVKPPAETFNPADLEAEAPK